MGSRLMSWREILLEIEAENAAVLDEAISIAERKRSQLIYAGNRGRLDAAR